MKNIYSKAEVVIGWLGPDVDGGSNALRTLSKLFRVVSDYPEGLEWLQQIPELYRVDKSMQENGRVHEVNTSLENLRELLSRPFWRRVWIYQELVLGSYVQLMCGVEIIQLPESRRFYLTVGRLAELRSSKPDFWRRDLWSQFHKVHLSVLDVIADFRLDWHNHGPDRSQSIFWDGPNGLFNSLMMTIRCQASGPRDHVFGLSGLVTIDIKPDYDEKATTAQLFLEVARRCLEAGNSRVLSFAGIGARKENSDSLSRLPMPSWVPDWRIDGYGMRQLRYLLSHAFPFDGVVRPLLTDPNALRWPGVVWDVVSKREANSREVFLEWDLIKQLDFQEPDSWTYPNGMLRAEAYVCLITSYVDERGGKLQPGSELFHEYASIFVVNICLGFQYDVCPADHILQFESIFKQHTKKDISEVIQLMFRRQFPEGGGLRESFDSSYSLSKEITLFSRRFFHTKKRYIGVGSLDMQEGDLVCVLQGHMLPVIRKLDEHYEYIGECDVIGIMDSEILEAVRDGEAEITESEIR